jgi:3-hydroxyisobutyrate dehydrogenase and related beta-hydroxyacid dehydrogenases
VQSGTLTIMVGGDADAYARVEPILRELGSPTHIGENGQGLVLKLAINISLACRCSPSPRASYSPTVPGSTASARSR